MARPGSLQRVSLLVLGLAVALLGATGTGNVDVSATLIANCTISGSTLAFGTYDVFNSTADDVSGAVLSVSCTRGAPGVTIGLDLGSNSSHASGACSTGTCTRAMGDGAGDFLSYDLYTTSGHTTVWNTSNTVSYAPTSMASTSLTVFGHAPALQDVNVASYTDSVTATVNF